MPCLDEKHELAMPDKDVRLCFFISCSKIIQLVLFI